MAAPWTRTRPFLGVVVALALAFGGTWAASAASSGASRNARAATVHAISGGGKARVAGAKSPTSRLAQTDRRLVRARTATPVSVVVKLDYDSFATYDGSRPDFAATSPAATGQPFDPRGASVRSYAKYAASVEAKFLGALRRTVPSAVVGRTALPD